MCQLAMQILTGIQDMLNNPNNSDPAQEEGYNVYRKNKVDYERSVLLLLSCMIFLNLKQETWG